MMIKRLLILGLVLALPAMASAVSVSLLSGGKSTLTLGTDVTVGEVITVDLVSDTACAAVSMIDYVAIGEGINAAGSWVAAAIPAPGPFNKPGTYATPSSILNAMMMANMGTWVNAGTVMYSFKATVNGVGTISPVMGAADLFFDSMFASTLGTSVVQNPLVIIPEPATIALLGLGGLLLRRRK